MIVRFVFANPNEWWKQSGATLLRWADGVPASHMAIQIETFTTSTYYEAVFPKARYLTKDEWQKHWTIAKVYEFEVQPNLCWEVKSWLISQIGVRYSLSQLLLIALCLIKPLNDKLNWAILNHNKYLICTELGSRFIEKFMNLELTESHDKIGLQDMFDLCEQLSFKNPERLWK